MIGWIRWLLSEIHRWSADTSRLDARYSNHDVVVHYYPPPWSRHEWAAGINRCYYCLHYDPKQRAVTDPPCSRRRPSGELVQEIAS